METESARKSLFILEHGAGASGCASNLQFGINQRASLRDLPASQAIADQATIGKSLVVKGEVTGSESLYIDGKVEGAINLPGNRVTVGRNGQVSANISAREVVVLGKVRGNINASDRVDIRSEGSLTGDVIAQRISIEDGAFFKGGIDIRKPGQTKDGSVAAVNSGAVESQKAIASA